PANVIITNRGQAKVLDFGLAKFVREPVGLAVAASASSQGGATAESAGEGQSSAGIAMGTAAYMSPEQARGQPVDKRTDIWAFGCVLYEMLTGRRAFVGDSLTDTLAHVIDREPDWRVVPETTPEVVRRLLERCLRKDVRRR